MRQVVLIDGKDYKQVIAKLETALRNPAKSEQAIRQALNILKKRD